MRIWQVGLLGLALLVGVARAQEPVPVGEQFQVNTYYTSYQRWPSVAADAAGNFVVVWESDGSYGSDTSYRSIQGQRYDAAGNLLDGQFQINSYTIDQQWTPAVAVAPDGNFVVVWESNGSYGTDTDESSIQGQRYDAEGTPLGTQFQVNSYTTSYQFSPSIALDAEGDFVVVWTSAGSYGSDNAGWSIQGQRYDVAGTPLGTQFQVNSYTTSYQFSPSIALDAEGDFVVVWSSAGSFGTDTDSWSVQGQRYDAEGSPIGAEFQVNSYTTERQYVPAVASDAEGNFVVVWTSEGSFGTDTDSWSIQGQRYDAAGSPIGAEFQVNSYTTSSQLLPSVAVETEGDFVVVWDSDGSYGSDTSYRSIQGQRYDVAGNPVGGEFQVNTYTTSIQELPAVEVTSPGRFVVMWRSFGSYGTDNDRSIEGQRFASPAIFADGFESGDTSAWSSSVP